MANIEWKNPLKALMERQLAWNIFVQHKNELISNPDLKKIVQDRIPGIRKELGLKKDATTARAIADEFILEYFNKNNVLKNWKGDEWWALRAPFHGAVRKTSKSVEMLQVSDIKTHSGNLYGFNIEFNLQSPRLHILVGINYPEKYFEENDHRVLYILHQQKVSKETGIYIGQATSAKDRLGDHLNDSTKKVDWWFMAYPEKDQDFNLEILSTTEMMLIQFWGEVASTDNAKTKAGDLNPSDEALETGSKLCELISASYIWTLRKQQRQIATKLKLDINNEWLPPFHSWQGTPGWSDCYWE